MGLTGSGEVGEAVASDTDLFRALDKCEPGQTVQLTVDRVQGDSGTQDVERGPRRLQLKVKLRKEPKEKLLLLQKVVKERQQKKVKRLKKMKKAKKLLLIKNLLRKNLLRKNLLRKNK